MRIVRFIDKDHSVRSGVRHQDGSVTLLEGSVYSRPADSGVVASPVTFLSPVEPSAILCIGLNFRDHAKEIGCAEPVTPVLFMKNPSALNHPGAPIVIPRSCEAVPEVDYEIELAVVIGKTAKDVKEDDALGHVLGYTIANDVSARRWQKSNSGQWVRAKSFDTFCPLGPELLTRDEIPDPQSLELVCRLNGEVMQRGSIGEMFFSVARIIALLSQDMTLLPGTVILTGTPSGVGVGRKPQVFLKPGDRLDLTIEPIGTLTNTVVSAPAL